MPLPFQLPFVSRGFAELTPAAVRTGVEAAAGAASSLAQLLGTEVDLRGRASPVHASPRAPAARVTLDLAALPGLAWLEVEPGLVVQLVDRLAGGEGAPATVTALTPVEAAALDLFALVALEGACGAAGLEAALSPRLARREDDARESAPWPVGTLSVELDVVAGPSRGRARLLLPPDAVRALRSSPALDRSLLALTASFRCGTAALLPAELEVLRPGDVILAEPGSGDRGALVLPGGFRLAGRLAESGFQVEELTMTTRTSQIPVTLEIELARLELPLAELARLEPGSFLPLTIDRRGLVTLRAGERAVARGELVDVDGAVGVRVLTLEVGP